MKGASGSVTYVPVFLRVADDFQGVFMPDIKEKKKRPVEQYEGDDFIAEYESAAEASRSTGISSTLIKNCYLGKIPEAGGYAWYRE